MRLRRRHLLAAGAVAVGGGVLTYGGSVAACRLAGFRSAGLIRPLFSVIAEIPEPDRIGEIWLSRVGPETLDAQLMQRTDLLALALVGDPVERRTGARGVFRDDFSRGDVVTLAGWVVSRAEALIAGAWVA